MGNRKSLNSLCRLIEQAQDEIPVEQAFLNDLKKSIEKEDLENARKPSLSYKPSSMNCIRGMYYQITGADVEPVTNGYCMIGICNSGTDTHNRIQDYVLGMREQGFDCEYVNVAKYVEERHLDDLEIVEQAGHETKLYHKKLKMRFMCDGIIKYKGRYYVLELKTELGAKWNNRKGVDPKHFMQGTAYSVAFGIDDVIFVYISRDTLDMKAFMFTPSDDMKNSMIGQIETCEEYVAKKVVPPMPDDIDPRTCNYCGYRALCKGV